MALILLIEKSQYVAGQVTRYVGDRWTLDLQVVDRIGTVDRPKNLEGASATAYFPATDEDGENYNLGVECEITNEEEGRLRAVVTEESTAEIQTSDGMPCWVAMDDLVDPDGLIHVRTLTPDLVVEEPLEFEG